MGSSGLLGITPLGGSQTPMLYPDPHSGIGSEQDPGGGGISTDSPSAVEQSGCSAVRPMTL